MDEHPDDEIEHYRQRMNELVAERDRLQARVTWLRHAYRKAWLRRRSMGGIIRDVDNARRSMKAERDRLRAVVDAAREVLVTIDSTTPGRLFAGVEGRHVVTQLRAAAAEAAFHKNVSYALFHADPDEEGAAPPGDYAIWWEPPDAPANDDKPQTHVVKVMHALEPGDRVRIINPAHPAYQREGTFEGSPDEGPVVGVRLDRGGWMSLCALTDLEWIGR